MKNIFYLTAGLLGLAGLLHLATLVMYPPDPGATISMALTFLMGVAYLLVSVLLFMQKEMALWAGIVVAVIGTLLVVIGRAADSITIFFTILNIAIVISSLYLIRLAKPTLSRVKVGENMEWVGESLKSSWIFTRKQIGYSRESGY